MLTIIESRADAPAAQQLMAQLSARLAAITGDDGRTHFAMDAPAPGALFLLAMADGEPVGCAALRPLGDGVGEVKRMFAARPAIGIGTALLSAIETRAAQAGYRALWLETRRVNETAVRFYLGHGYAVRTNYGPYVGRLDAVCFEKNLRPSP